MDHWSRRPSQTWVPQLTSLEHLGTQNVCSLASVASSNSGGSSPENSNYLRVSAAFGQRRLSDNVLTAPGHRRLSGQTTLTIERKYHCTARLQFDWFGFNYSTTCKIFSSLVKSKLVKLDLLVLAWNDMQSLYSFYPNKTEWASEASSLYFERGRKNGV